MKNMPETEIFECNHCGEFFKSYDEKNGVCQGCKGDLDEYLGHYDQPTADLFESVDDSRGERNEDPFANAVSAIEVDWDDLPF